MDVVKYPVSYRYLKIDLSKH